LFVARIAVKKVSNLHIRQEGPVGPDFPHGNLDIFIEKVHNGLNDRLTERSIDRCNAIHGTTTEFCVQERAPQLTTRFVPTDRLLFGRNKRMIGWFSSKWISGKQSKTSKKLTNPALVWFH